MPVSGLPTNSALLKTTKGSSGPSTKPFQKAASGPAGSTPAAGRLAGRFSITVVKARAHPASSTDSAITAMSQPERRVGDLAGKAVSAAAACDTGSPGVGGAGRG